MPSVPRIEELHLQRSSSEIRDATELSWKSPVTVCCSKRLPPHAGYCPDVAPVKTVTGNDLNEVLIKPRRAEASALPTRQSASQALSAMRKPTPSAAASPRPKHIRPVAPRCAQSKPRPEESPLRETRIAPPSASA